MFSNPLKQVAEEYLYTSDSSVREQTQRQLIRAGSSAIPLLMDALIVTLRKFNSASWGKKRMEIFADVMIKKGLLGGKYADMMKEQIREMSNQEGDGISFMQTKISREARDFAWQVISQIGESAIKALFVIVNDRDKLKRLTAAFALSAEEHPSRFVVNSIITFMPTLQKLGGDEMGEATVGLLIRTWSLSGDKNAIELMSDIAQHGEMSYDECNEMIIDVAMTLIAKSK